MRACKCGCGQTVPKRRTFVNKEHQLVWMTNGGAAEMNALLPDEARVKGGAVSGRVAADSGRLAKAGLLGGKRSKQIAADFRRARGKGRD